MPFSIRRKRIYDPSEPDDGVRILVDRLWPRGIRREDAQIEEWCRDIAPSSAIRKAFSHEADRFPAFAAAYREELDASEAAAAFLARCRGWLGQTNVTFLYAAKDTVHNNAAVLQARADDALK